MQKDTLLGKYSFYLLGYSHRPLTDNLYVNTAGRYIDWNEKHNIDITVLDRTSAFRQFFLFMEEKKNQKLMQAYLYNIVCCLKSFFKFLAKEFSDSYLFWQLIELPKCGKKIPRVFNYVEIERFLNVIDRKNIIGIRDYCIFELIYSSGLRISEARNILLNSINFNDRLIKISGKGGNERIVPYGKVAARAMSEYMGLRLLLSANNFCKYFFISSRGSVISTNEIRHRFRIYADKADLKDCTVHTLRHTCATHLLLGGADIYTISAILGHSDITTTQIYTHLSGKDLAAAYDKYFPGI